MQKFLVTLSVLLLALATTACDKRKKTVNNSNLTIEVTENTEEIAGLKILFSQNSEILRALDLRVSALEDAQVPDFSSELAALNELVLALSLSDVAQDDAIASIENALDDLFCEFGDDDDDDCDFDHPGHGRRSGGPFVAVDSEGNFIGFVGRNLAGFEGPFEILTREEFEEGL